MDYCEICSREYDYDLDVCNECGVTYCEYCGIVDEGVCHDCIDELDEEENSYE